GRHPVVRLPDAPDEFTLAESEGGFRLSYLVRGWDLSLIYYDQAEKNPVFFQRRVDRPVGPDVIVLQPQHPRLHIVGGTLSKSIEPVVLRGELTYTIGKTYETSDPQVLRGVERRDTLDYLVGVDYSLLDAVDFSLQVIQKILAGSGTNLSRGSV